MKELGRQWQLTSSNNSRIPQEYGLFIGACGADARAYEALRYLRSIGIQMHQSLFFDFVERKGNVSPEEREKYNEYQGLAPQRILIEGEALDRSCSMRDFLKHARALGSLQSVALDISVFTKPHFFSILVALKKYLHLQTIDIYYTEPISYIKPSPDRYEFSKGPYELIEIPGFPGVDPLKARRLLILLLGFDGVEATHVNDEVAPSRTIPVNGFPSYLFHFKDISLIENRTLLSDGDIRNSLLFAPANNPFETFNTLQEVVDAEKPNDYATTIAPLGTKPMALGAAILGLRNQSIRIVHPAPSAYVSKISNDVGRSWLYRITL